MKIVEVTTSPALLQSLLPFWACVTMFAPPTVTLLFLESLESVSCFPPAAMIEICQRCQRQWLWQKKAARNKVALSKGW